MKAYRFFKPIKRNKSKDPFVILSGKIRNSKINTVSRTKWAEDTYISEKKEKETIGKSFNIAKLPFATGILLFFLFFLLAKTAWLQIVKGDYYYSMAEGNRIRIERLEPNRGVIYDRQMRPLVRNNPNFLLYLIPADLPDEPQREEIIQEISEILDDISRADIIDIIKSVKMNSLEAYRPLFVADHIEYEPAMALYLRSSVWPGVVLSNRTNREYLRYIVGEEEPVQGDSLSHVLGYTGKINTDELEKFGEEYLPIDYIGKMGIEYFWENELKGESGKKQIEVDAFGKEKKLLGEIKPVDGNNLVLSLDLVQQLKLEEILRAHLDRLKLNRASGIIVNPNNGEILAMVCWPAYSNNSFARGISRDEYNKLIEHPDKPLFNRCISGEYPSGSIIKPIIAAAALEENIISEKTSFLSVGGIRIGQWFFPDWLAGGHGTVDVRTAIAVSANTFFYNIGGGYNDFNGLGVDRIVEYGEKFGLGAQTGVDLAGERTGFLPTAKWKKEVKGERWYIGDTYHLAIGQGDLLITPLQAAVYTSVFANGGKLYRPHFIKEILNGDDEFIKATENVPIREEFIDPYNITVVRQGMRRTVTHGSARSLQTVPVAVAGKTGTAQWSTKKETHAWFTGFAPYDNPELVIIIMVEEGGEGSGTAVPIAREYLEWYFGERLENYPLD